MSFEGYYQSLCINGHNMKFNSGPNCLHCKEGIGWENLVDVTNGSFCQGVDKDCCLGCEYCDKGRIDGYIELKVIKETVYSTCACCGHKKMVEPAVYAIPE